MGDCIFEKNLPMIVSKCYRRKNDVFRQNIFKIARNLPTGIWSLTYRYGYCWCYEHFHSKKTQPQPKLITVKMSRELKKLRLTMQMKDLVLHSLVRTRDTFLGSNVGREFGVMLREERPQKPEFAYDIVRIYSLMIYTDLIEYNIVGDTKAPLLCCFPFNAILEAGDIISTGPNVNYQTLSSQKFRPLLKNSFHSKHIVLRDKNPLYL